MPIKVKIRCHTCTKQDPLHQCRMWINADENPIIDPIYLSMPINSDQCRWTVLMQLRFLFCEGNRSIVDARLKEGMTGQLLAMTPF